MCNKVDCCNHAIESFEHLMVKDVMVTCYAPQHSGGGVCVCLGMAACVLDQTLIKRQLACSPQSE